MPLSRSIGVKQVQETINLVITHNGEEWVAENEGIIFIGKTLDELDSHIRQKLLKTGYKKATINMFFDSRTIPVWIRQYASHYFNRTIFLDQ
jgi:hypothetical protein